MSSRPTTAASYYDWQQAASGNSTIAPALRYLTVDANPRMHAQWSPRAIDLWTELVPTLRQQSDTFAF